MKGRCPLCGEPIDSEFCETCAECREQAEYAEQRADREANGLICLAILVALAAFGCVVGWQQWGCGL